MLFNALQSQFLFRNFLYKGPSWHNNFSRTASGNVCSTLLSDWIENVKQWFLSRQFRVGSFMIWKSQDMSVVTTRDLQYLSHRKTKCGFSNQRGVIFLSPDLLVASKTTSGTMCTPFTPTLIQQQVWRHGRQQLSDRRHGKAFISNYFLGFEPVEWAWISFEAGGRTFHPVVFHSMSGTLISILEGFFINIICF